MSRLTKIKLDNLLICLTIFLNGLGFVLKFAGINVVYFFALVSIVVLVINTVILPAKIRRLFDHRKLFIWVFFLFWIIYALVQGFYALDISLYYIGLSQLITNFFVVIFVLYLLDFKSYNDLDVLYKAVFMVLLVNTLLGLIEIAFGYHFVEASSIWAVDHVRGLAGNENDYATTSYCSIVILVILQHFIKEDKGISNILIALGVLCIFMTSSRGVSLAIIIYAALYLFSRFYFKNLKKMVFLLKISIILFCITVIFLMVFGLTEDIVTYLIMRFSGSGSEISDFYRWQLIQESVKCFTRTMGFGVGPGQSIYYLQSNPHNFFFEILAEYGFIFFVTIISLFVYIWTGAFNPKIATELKAMYFAVIPSMVIASVSASSILKFKLFWIGIVLLYLLRKSNYPCSQEPLPIKGADFHSDITSQDKRILNAVSVGL